MTVGVQELIEWQCAVAVGVQELIEWQCAVTVGVQELRQQFIRSRC